jgi:hypothetical protein
MKSTKKMKLTRLDQDALRESKGAAGTRCYGYTKCLYCNSLYFKAEDAQLCLAIDLGNHPGPRPTPIAVE